METIGSIQLLRKSSCFKCTQSVGNEHRIYFSKLSLILSFPLNCSALSVDVVVTELAMGMERPEGSP